MPKPVFIYWQIPKHRFFLVDLRLNGWFIIADVFGRGCFAIDDIYFRRDFSTMVDVSLRCGCFAVHPWFHLTYILVVDRGKYIIFFGIWCKLLLFCCWLGSDNIVDYSAHLHGWYGAHVRCTFGYDVHGYDVRYCVQTHRLISFHCLTTCWKHVVWTQGLIRASLA